MTRCGTSSNLCRHSNVGVISKEKTVLQSKLMEHFDDTTAHSFEENTDCI